MLGNSHNISPDNPTVVATNQITYALRAPDEDHSEYSVAGLTAPLAKKIIVRHQMTNAGNLRSNVRFENTVVDSTNVAATPSVSITFDRPPNTAVTEAVMVAMLCQIANWMCSGTSALAKAVLNREV